MRHAAARAHFVLETEILSGLREGSPAAAEALFDRYHAGVYALAMSILRNEGDAGEAVQDAFVTVVRKPYLFPGEGALSTWVYRLCVDLCLVRLRRRPRTEAAPIAGFLPAFNTDGTHARPVEDWSREVERWIPERALGQVIRRYAENLPVGYRVVFSLCDVHGLSCEQTAQILDLSVPSVRSRLHRARLVMRERLSHYLRDGSAA